MLEDQEGEKKWKRREWLQRIKDFSSLLTIVPVGGKKKKLKKVEREKMMGRKEGRKEKWNPKPIFGSVVMPCQASE